MNSVRMSIDEFMLDERCLTGFCMTILRRGNVGHSRGYE